MVRFTFKEEIQLKDLHLHSNFIFHDKITVLNVKVPIIEEKRSSFTANLKYSTVRSSDIIVGGIVGFPKCGKSSFLEILLQHDFKNKFQDQM